MPYYIRVLGKTNPDIHLNEFIDGLSQHGLRANFDIDPSESVDNWSVLVVANEDGEDLVQIERNPVTPGELGFEELDEFREEIKDYKPKSAVKWLDQYFNQVKVIYAFQLLNAAFDDDNYRIIEILRSTILARTSGIMQADNEGFSNEEGFHILWQFSDDVEGEWNMAVKNFWGQWVNFRMDLGNISQRQEFWEGKVPKGAIRL